MTTFNPLIANSVNKSVLLELQRRNLNNVLDSYHGSYDVFAEMIQNAVDAIDRARNISNGFTPKLCVEVDIPNKQFTVIDNGDGVSGEIWPRILAPHESFQSDGTNHRGHKGVGFSYLAYGFERLEIATKSIADGETRAGRISGGRKWVTKRSNTCPEVENYHEDNQIFQDLDHGTLVRVTLDTESTPKGFNLLGGRRNSSYDIQRWKTILLTKTAAGSIPHLFAGDSDLKMDLRVLAPNRDPQNEYDISCVFQLPCPIDSEFSSPYLNLSRMEEEGIIGDPGNMYTNKRGMYFVWDTERLETEMATMLTGDRESLRGLISTQSVWAYAFMAWDSKFFSDNMDIRGDKGLLCASKKMPLIPTKDLVLNRYQGSSEFCSVIVHMNDATPDMGRKSLPSDLDQLCTLIGRSMVNEFYKQNKRAVFLQPNDGRGQHDGTLFDWQTDAMRHHEDNPLKWKDTVFPLVSKPQQEQEVVTLFGQMVACGILPGYQIYAAAEGNQRYDSIMKFEINEDCEGHIFSSDYPQGLDEGILTAPRRGSRPLCVEFKFELQSILSELSNESPNSKQFGEIDILIAWKADGFNDGISNNYLLESCSYPSTSHARRFIGETHRLKRAGVNESIPVIILKDLFELANKWELGISRQASGYHRSDS